MANNSIGFFDSGLGGLAILKKVREYLPNTAINYLGDTKSLPLGIRSIKYIRERTIRGVEFLFSRGSNIVVLACNTASVTSIRKIQQVWLRKKRYSKKNVLGVSLPLLEEMRMRRFFLKSKRGLILSTPATKKQNFYSDELKKLGFKYVEEISGKNLAMQIEAGDKKTINEEVREILKSHRKTLGDIEFVIFACTHYPLVEEIISPYFTKETLFIDPSDWIARRLKKYLKRHPEYKINGGPITYWLTANHKGFKARAEKLLGVETTFNLGRL